MTPPAATLGQVLGYENDWVVHKFCERYALSFAAASDVFLETKRWLWLVAHAQQDPAAPTLTLIGFDSLTVVDEMWHTFILFTQPYAEFCQASFGRFIHHAPATQADRQRSAIEHAHDAGAFDQARLDDFRIQARYVGERLGPDTVRKWFRTYARRYSLARLDRLLVPRAQRSSRYASSAQARRRTPLERMGSP
ncbi:MAG: hypothetical protein ABW321_14880 [Polyangiales bacterium]